MNITGVGARALARDGAAILSRAGRWSIRIGSAFIKAPGGQQPTSYDQVDGDIFVDIRALMPGELRAAATILAHGVRDNPLHVKVFGRDPDRRQRRLLGFLGHLVAYIRPNAPSGARAD
jgi:hypothetical protein